MKTLSRFYKQVKSRFTWLAKLEDESIMVSLVNIVYISTFNNLTKFKN